MKMQNIVVGCDGSPDGNLALETAADLAVGSGATVHVVAVSDAGTEAEILRTLASLPEEYQHVYDCGAHERDILIDAARMVESRGVTCETHQRQGDVAQVILDVAKEADADLVVVGSRGLARGTRHLRGSVSTKIAAHADRSFLVVRSTEGD